MKPSTQSTQSPFAPPQPARLSYSIMLLLLLMVVSAGLAMLVLLALRVPIFSGELRALLGWTQLESQGDSGRAAHVTFVVFLYTAPLGLGMAVFLLQQLMEWFGQRRRRYLERDEEEYRMS